MTMRETIIGPLGSPSRRDLLIGGAMAACAGVAFARDPHTRIASIKANELDRIVPLQLAPWHYQSAAGIVLPPPDELARLLYDQQSSRSYAAEDELPVMLVMAYGSSQGGALQVHRPEICYPASGFRLTDTVVRDLRIGNGKTIPTRFFTARSDTRVEQVLYWTRIADVLPTSWTGQRIAIMRSNLAGYVPDGLLVRVSTIHEDPVRAKLSLDRFCRTMLAAIGPEGRRMLVGQHYA